MAQVQINAAESTFVLNGTSITDFVEGDYITITPANELTTQTNGANGSVNINKRLDGDVADVMFKVLKYSDADVFMQNEINQDSPTVFNGSIKQPFIRGGSDFVENHICEGGSITTKPTFTDNNQEGNNTVEYTIRFRSVTRLI